MTAPNKSTLCSTERAGGIAFPRSQEKPEHQAVGDAVFFAVTGAHAALPVKEGTQDVLVIWFGEAS